MNNPETKQETTIVQELLPARLQSGHVEINVRVSAAMNYTPVAARRKVNVLLLEKVGTGLYGDDPKLVVNDRIRWRVPVILALPAIGRLGQVGEIDIDVQTGEVLAEPDLLKEIATHATRLVAGATPQTE
jgi:hypothetical protein